MLYAGLDLSRKRLDFHLLDGEGATIEVGAAPPDADGLLGLTRRLDRHREPIRAAIESMNGARFVHDRLELAGWQVEIADAQKVKGLAPLACKTDRIDACDQGPGQRDDRVQDPDPQQGPRDVHCRPYPLGSGGRRRPGGRAALRGAYASDERASHQAEWHRDPEPGYDRCRPLRRPSRLLRQLPHDRLLGWGDPRSAALDRSQEGWAVLAPPLVAQSATRGRGRSNCAGESAPDPFANPS
jgi:hypothetical protein